MRPWRWSIIFRKCGNVARVKRFYTFSVYTDYVSSRTDWVICVRLSLQRVIIEGNRTNFLLLFQRKQIFNLSSKQNEEEVIISLHLLPIIIIRGNLKITIKEEHKICSSLNHKRTFPFHIFTLQSRYIKTDSNSRGKERKTFHAIRRLSVVTLWFQHSFFSDEALCILVWWMTSLYCYSR